MAFRSSSDKITYVPEDTYFVIPGNQRQIFISMVAGGGMGGAGSISSGNFVAGGGGGAGGACVRIPFYNEGYVSFDCHIGKGGNFMYPDGNDTSVDIYVNDSLFTTYTVSGGKAANGQIGGAGGKGWYTFNGLNGENGSISVSSQVPTAGNGGSSLHFNGGSRQTYDMIDNTLTSGYYGSGGGGGLPGSDSSLIGNGGDGFLVVEYI